MLEDIGTESVISTDTHFKETRPRFIRNALVKAAIPLLLMELLCSLEDGVRKKEPTFEHSPADLKVGY